MDRRTALKAMGLLSTVLALPFITKAGQGRIKDPRLLDRIQHDKNWPYPKDCMDSAERIWFEENEAWINILPKAGKSLDIKIYASSSRDNLSSKPPIHKLTGIRGSLDLSIGTVHSPRLYYRVEYREGSGAAWQALPRHKVRTPNASLENGDTVRIIIKADDHVAGDLKLEPTEPERRREWLRGDYITTMMREILRNPSYCLPEYFLNSRAIQGFTSARQSLEIIKRNPDVVIDVGDTTGHDWYGIWGKNDQWSPELQPFLNLIEQSDILWQRKRRAEAGITATIPTYLALGNHDGEVSWSHETQPFTQPYAKADRKKYWRQPENQNYFPVKWANGDIMFLILDVNSYLRMRPADVTDWTLGDKQRQIIEEILWANHQVPWKFICFHNALGGWSSGTGDGGSGGSYGRGPLFELEDYERDIEIANTHPCVPDVQHDPRSVEQVWLTELAKDAGVRGFLYGHDHIFSHKILKNLTADRKEMFAACAGSSKCTSENRYENAQKNPFWTEFYGEGRPGFKDPPDYLSPPGFTELEIDKNGATIRYICSAPTFYIKGCNLPIGTQPGDVVFEHRISDMGVFDRTERERRPPKEIIK